MVHCYKYTHTFYTKYLHGDVNGSEHKNCVKFLAPGPSQQMCCVLSICLCVGTNLGLVSEGELNC